MDTFMLTSLIPLYCTLGGYASAEVNDREPYLKKIIVWNDLTTHNYFSILNGAQMFYQAKPSTIVMHQAGGNEFSVKVVFRICIQPVTVRFSKIYRTYASPVEARRDVNW